MTQGQIFEPGYGYFCRHEPSGEEWYVLGIDVKGDRVCVAGWPQTIAKLSDCVDFVKRSPLDEKELEYRQKTFGTNWI